ncbi:glucosamine kinase [Collimonas sp. OK307]|uniref:BadF/BadG/BcrA/BcrD ATPase family protein n=1 Tax=Collimonas sp. OK307 TaxID=1801620 RepID=UPI0008E80AE5|nr:BadF/BadG/BcrA/BcrD ATPase family protein [Collimonas sp. OK307]SFH86023.1 glucosamine kinase [Collimonas sp. OK307]
MTTDYGYLIGVDGGGTKTHVRIHTADGTEIAEATAGPSALMHGRQAAWAAICDAIQAAFCKSGITPPVYEHMALGCGLSGVNVPQWADEFSGLNPGFGSLAIASDAITTLLGAHQGKPGAIVAIGTGSIGAALLADGRLRTLGGWGFPSGDEASGAWLGLHAINHVQQVFDGRANPDILSADVMQFCGGNNGNGDRNCVLGWLARANQSMYAQLAPLVSNHVIHSAVARNIMEKAGSAIEKLALALDPSARLPLALCGGLAVPLQEFLPPALRQRAICPVADSAAGGLILIRQQLAMECI